ncbi:MAG: hypothetical protein RKO68_06270 [Candidatus Accumulibacter sp.]|nr:hypothetical protein [Accumulibacter sp.]
MATTSPHPAPSPARRKTGWLWLLLLLVLALPALWIWAMMSWSYSAGERAGWVQKFSKKGWICKTWEGELALVTMPGTAQEKFLFTVWDDGVAKQINDAMGKRVSLQYDEKVGLPGSCFGETRYWVRGIKVVDEIPLAPGIVVPSPHAATPTAPVAAPQPLPPSSPVQVPPAPAAAPVTAPTTANVPVGAPAPVATTSAVEKAAK